MDYEAVCFKNVFKEFNDEKLLGEDKKLTSSASEKLQEAIFQLLKYFERNVGLDEDSSRPDFSVFTGTCGYALLYCHMHKCLKGVPGKFDTDCFLPQALTYLKEALLVPLGRRISFLCGDAGPLAVGALVYSKIGDERNADECINRLESMHINVIRDQTLPDEHLYGRCGYLSALMYVQHYLGWEKVDKEIIVKVTRAVLDSGQALAAQTKDSSPMMFQWHNKKYLGAAHGMAGILYTLLLVDDPEVSEKVEKAVRPCVDMLLTTQFQSGNFPSSLGSCSGDRLVQWCHGAPGWVCMFAQAYKVFKDKRYLEAAEQCCEVTWQRGLLTKGYGLCHGASGNAYAFLTLFRLTHDQKHLYRAWKFTEWCCDFGKHQCRTPDRPLSLFEGLAGTIYFMVDMLDPLNAKFPAYEY